MTLQDLVVLLTICFTSIVGIVCLFTLMKKDNEIAQLKWDNAFYKYHNEFLRETLDKINKS